MRVSRLTTVLAALLGIGLFACTQQGQSADGATPKKTGAVLANVGNEVITTDDFKAKMEEQSPFIRARYTTLERKKEFLENLVKTEVLAQEAKRRGLDQDPEVQSTLKRVMVQKLIRAEYEKDKEQAIPEEELKAFYQEHLDDYVKAERVRVHHILLAADATNRAQVKREAAKLLAEVKGKEKGPNKTAFIELAKARSDDASSKAAGGDLTFRTQEELTKAFGESFAKAAFGLTTIGEIGPIVESEKGVHLVKLTGKQNAINRTFDSVRTQIENRLSRDTRAKRFDTFVNDLKAKANVKVNDEALAELEVVPAGNVAQPTAARPGGPGAAIPNVRPLPASKALPPGVVPALKKPAPEKQGR